MIVSFDSIKGIEMSANGKRLTENKIALPQKMQQGDCFTSKSKKKFNPYPIGCCGKSLLLSLTKGVSTNDIIATKTRIIISNF